jgi:hypothetical protein
VRGEIDSDADVEVAHVVVSVRGHALVRDDFEGVCGSVYAFKL